MAFSDFKYPAVLADLGLSEASADDLFADVPPVPPGPGLAATLPASTRLATAAQSEFSKAVWIVGPVLGDLWARNPGRVSLFGGVEFAPDPAAKLAGFCDFLLGRGPQLQHVTAPVAVLFEAKRDAITDGFGQCIAGMVGVQRFNRQRGAPIDPVYGCSTTGSLWRFLSLSGTTVTIDLTEYAIRDVGKLLGILTHMIGP